MVAYRFDGSSFPLTSAQFVPTDGAGLPSTLAAISPDGLVTALAEGQVTVQVTAPGSNAAPKTATLEIYGPLASGRRVVVVDRATRAPIQGASVVGCDAPPAGLPCPVPVELTTDARGVALFPFVGARANFSVGSPTLRADGLPRFERVSIAQTQATTVLVPLGPNPVHSAAGFNGSITFFNVPGNGNLWVGLAITSLGDPTEADLGGLLGEPFGVAIPGVPGTLSVPGSVVLYTSPGLGIAQEIKGRSLGLGQPGRRFAIAFAGKSDVSVALSLRTTSLLSYVGAMSYATQPQVNLVQLPRVPDVIDLDGDGRCHNPQICPAGPEDLPDYYHFPALSLGPRFEQDRRTEIILPPIPVGFDTVLIAATEVAEEAGILPTGFASQTLVGLPAATPVPPILLKSGPARGGVEISQPGVWALVSFASGQGAVPLPLGTGLSARLAHGPVIPTRVALAPFLPVVGGGTYSSASRSFAPPQPGWSRASSAGGELAKIVLSGVENRHVFLSELAGNQTALRVPDAPAAGGLDPAASPGSTLEVTVIDLVPGVTAADVLDMAGPDLANVHLFLDGYSRFTGP